jgi:creatinine amidohydrolase
VSLSNPETAEPRKSGVCVAELAQQSYGSHADELETSLMLALAPHLVDMARAEASAMLQQEAPGALTRTDIASPNYSRSGSFGDPTSATQAKGKILLSAMVDDLIATAEGFLTGKANECAEPDVVPQHQQVSS